jgi:hypothetical protein
MEALNTVLKSASNEEIDSFFAGVAQAVSKLSKSRDNSFFMVVVVSKKSKNNQINCN